MNEREKRFYSIERVTQSLKKSVEVIQSLFRWKYIDQLFLVPITIWTMIESTFLLAQFTRVRTSFSIYVIFKSSIFIGIYYLSCWYSVRILYSIHMSYVFFF